MWRLEFNQLCFLFFVCSVYAQIVHCTQNFFDYTKAMLMRCEHHNNAPTTIAVGLKTLLQQVLIQLWDKWPNCFSNQTVSAKNDRNVSV